MAWSVLVWNMARMSPDRPDRDEDNWAYFLDLVERLDVQIALLNEASCAYLRGANAQAREQGFPEPAVFSDIGTIARDPKTRKRWSAAVYSRLGPELLDADSVRAQSEWRAAEIPFRPSRPGTWVAAKVPVGPESISSVALYGLIEEFTDASMHTSISEVSPLFNDPTYQGTILVGGDFNIGTALAGVDSRRSANVLERLEAYDLADCLETWRLKTGLPTLSGCPCRDDPCLHSLTRLYPAEPDSLTPWPERIAPQVDYLFASRELADRVSGVHEVPPEEWEQHSDHAPIVVEFEDP